MAGQSRTARIVSSIVRHLRVEHPANARRLAITAPLLLAALWVGCADGLPTEPRLDDDRDAAGDTAQVAPAPASEGEDLSGLSTVCRVLSRHLEEVRREVENGPTAGTALLSTAEDLEKALQHTCG